jgi:hypothetical protein
VNTPVFGPITATQSARAGNAKKTETVIRRLRKFSGKLPLAVVGPWTMGVVIIYTYDDDATATLERMCPPDSPDHTWADGAHGRGLLVESRYANDIVEGLREQGVFVP